jgi:UDP-N-acetylglucosamine--N-acetylmuramyl-(pentapeptide) pyrophosphoryl-undecaprenol N-acetylglucosamine transferase
MDAPDIHILIAGGGTGGHLFPGIAMARAFLARNPENRILFVGTDRPFETSILAAEGFDHRAIPAAGIKGLGLFKKIKALFKLPGALWCSASIIRQFQPDLVIGVGGYSSGPVALAARLMGRIVVVQEQNILPGVTNRMISRFARRIHVSFGESLLFFPHSRPLLTGNPVRQIILDARERRKTRQAGGDRFTVMVAGGSQGAHSVNLALIEALPHLDKNDGWQFIHQTGANDEAMVREAYEAEGITARVQAFFTDMDAQYEAADLIVCRAGATSIAEITAMGLPSILIPFPYAADDHQVKNAVSLVNRGAADMITEDVLTGNMLAERLTYYRNHPDELAMMAENADICGKPRAAEDIVDDCYALIGNGESASLEME